LNKSPKSKNQQMNINDILQQYHQKFDDGEVRVILENLEQMMHERAEFFRDFQYGENKDVDKTTSDQVDEYWGDIDDLAYGSNQHDEILNKLQYDVKGMKPCWCCRRIAIIRTKLTKSILSDEIYLVKMCEKCYSSKHAIARYGKNKIDAESIIPVDLSEQEKEIMTSFQKSLEKIS